MRINSFTEISILIIIGYMFLMLMELFTIILSKVSLSHAENPTLKGKWERDEKIEVKPLGTQSEMHIRLEEPHRGSRRK